VSGVVAVSAVVIGLLSFTFGTDTTQWPISVLAFATTGVFAALAVYSFFPQKIMPGYSATTAAGLLLATMSILSTAKIGTAMVVMGLPLLDAGISIVRRLVRGKKPWEGDREHFHHLLLRIGWSKRKIALFYWLFSALWGIVALFGNTQIKIGAFLLMGTFIIGISIWLHYWDYSRQHDQDNG
jgi:UDP-GlcNAc:undecaprenyl-phosphate GlcNAc-1-phosphate transferase